jgi:pyrrolidone-carboxylate peptidase
MNGAVAKRRFALPIVIGLVVSAAATVAMADPSAVAGRWTERWGVFNRRTARFELAPRADGTYQASTSAPRSGDTRRITLRRAGEGWELLVERRQFVVGMSNAVAGEEGNWTWAQCSLVALKAKDGRLEGGGFVIDLPTAAAGSAAPPADPTSAPSRPPVSPGALGEPSASELPVVRVLITGFDRFPTLRNHPSVIHRDEDQRAPQVNPSGWAVRNFDVLSLDPALRQRVRVELHRLNDVPVFYVEGARAITTEIERVDADVAISFGVGAGGNADADVESVCFNLMHDGSGMSNEGEGPFQLPASWPPSTPRDQWSDEDRAWLWRYPDNAGVSYNRKKIDPARPDELRSSLPVSSIVSRAEREGLDAHDGMGGPGNYICNNVMFKVVDTQAARGRMGGFIHLAQWNEARSDRYLKVLRCAVEESVKAFLERPTN